MTPRLLNRSALIVVAAAGLLMVSACGKQGKLVDKGYVYKLLNNRVYIGEAVHKGVAYPGEHQAIMKSAGYTREDVKQYVFAHSKISNADLKRMNLKDGALAPGDETSMVDLVETPDDLLVIAAGGKAGVQSCYIPGWGGKDGSQAVTKEIRKP